MVLGKVVQYININMSIPTICFPAGPPPANLAPVIFDNSFAIFTHDVAVNKDLYVAGAVVSCSTTTETLSATTITAGTINANALNLTTTSTPTGPQPLIPVGAIMMWSGNPSALPSGWYLCNGQTVATANNFQTPDLRGRFIVGFNPDNTAYNTIGNIGGANTVTLNANQIPAHTHPANTSSAGAHTHDWVMTIFRSQELGDAIGRSGVSYTNPGELTQNSTVPGGVFAERPIMTIQQSGTHTHTVTVNQNTPAGAAHENRPPYYTLAYIIYLGV